MIGFYSFLKDSEKAHFYIQDLFHQFTRENLMTVSPKGIAGAPEDIFSFDATEASVAAMCDMLMQSHNGYIEFLPALPAVWKEGSVKGICAQGALEADIDWKDNSLSKASIRANKDADFKVKLPEGAKVTCGGKVLNPKRTKDGLVSLSLLQDQQLEIEI